ncbi:MAG: hypothetical protein OQK69_11445 [Gammaproteobacteria bacterium]|nr:hypothetical protein [Gammaproteobacteria bacterium]
MAIELRYDQQFKYLLAQVNGYLSFEDVQNFMVLVLTSDEIPSDADTLWDITNMEFDNIDLDLQTKIIEMRKKFDDQRGNAKIAIVSDYQLGEVLVKLFLVLTEDIKQDVNAFKTREEAMLWFAQS